MDTTECMIKILKELQQKNLPLEIYYAEEMIPGEIKWSVDILNNSVCELCRTAWFLTIISKAEDIACREEFEYTAMADYEIIIDEPFSDAVACKGVEIWLEDNNIKLDIVMIDFISAAPYSGYIKGLMDRDFDDEIKNAVPIE